jgi:indole-3-acetate monooxygenase
MLEPQTERREIRMTTAYQPGATGTSPVLTPGTTDIMFDVDARLLDSARAIGPIIREHADEAERERRLSKPVIDALIAAGFQRMFTPRALGGLEVDPITCARVVEEIAAFDSAAGWALQAGNTGAWWCARLPSAGTAEIFATGPDLVMAASFQPPHRAVEVPGGYRFTGRGPLASTIHDAEWLMMTALVMDGEQPRMTAAGPEVVGLVLHARDAQIIDTWQSLGMRGTDSNDVAADDVFVPTSRTFAVVPEFEPGPQFRGPLYRLPAITSVLVVIVPVALAIARGAITELHALAQRKTPLGSTRTLRDRAVVQATLAEAEGMLRSARLLFYDTLAAAWRRAQAGEPSTLEQKADLLLAGTHATRSAARVADMMHRLAGTSGIYARNRLERLFRDAQTVRHHGFSSESRFEAVGQVYLGLPPEFVLMAF